MSMAEPASGGTAPARAAGLTIGVPREIVPGERRVSIIPEAAGRLVKRGNPVLVEAGAGEAAYLLDDQYTAAGAEIVPDARTLYRRADLILKIHRPQERPDGSNELDLMQPGQTLVAFLAPLFNPDLVQALAQRQVTAFSMDAIPRTTRAQYMDALSSMGTIAGYKAVLLAADYVPRFFPLLMTAAGTIAPAKVLIIGAGVAGLQAIGTARRLGAVVEAYDARPVVKEQVESLGAKFVEIDIGSSDTQTAGGYAREMTPEQIARQQEGLAARCAANDVVITTALVPGRPAPRLVTADAVQRMKPGSVIVDLAGETGGNCELTVPGETVERHHVTIMSPLNLPATLPIHASQMYAKNLQNLLDLFLTKDGRLELNFSDDIVKATCITHAGEILHEPTRQKLGLADLTPPPAPEPEPEPEPLEAAAAEVTAAEVITEAESESSLDDDVAEEEEGSGFSENLDELADADAAGFVPPVSIEDTLPASREMLERAARELEEELDAPEGDRDLLESQDATDTTEGAPRQTGN